MAGGAAPGDAIVVQAGRFGGQPSPLIGQRAPIEGNAFVRRASDNLAQEVED